MPNESVPYVKASNYASAVASSVSLSGPTPDGLVHISFIRDIQVPLSQEYELEPLDLQMGEKVKAVQLKNAGAVHTQYQKEIVATLSVNVEALEDIAKNLFKMVEVIKKARVRAPNATP